MRVVRRQAGREGLTEVRQTATLSTTTPRVATPEAARLVFRDNLVRRGEAPGTEMTPVPGALDGVYVGTYDDTVEGWGSQLFRITPDRELELIPTPLPNADGDAVYAGAVASAGQDLIVIADGGNGVFQSSVVPPQSSSDWTFSDFPRNGVTQSGHKIAGNGEIVLIWSQGNFSGIPAAQAEHSLVRSDDAGLSWVDVPLPVYAGSGVRPNQIRYSRGRFYRWYHFGDTPIEWSVDGETWVAITLPMSTINTGVVYAGEGVWCVSVRHASLTDGVWVSDDDGQTWDFVARGAPGMTPGNNPGDLIGWDGQVVFYKRAKGGSWVVTAGFADNTHPLVAVAGGPVADDLVYFFHVDPVVEPGTSNVGIMHDQGFVVLTDDNGETFDVILIGGAYEGNDGYWYPDHYPWSMFAHPGL